MILSGMKTLPSVFNVWYSAAYSSSCPLPCSAFRRESSEANGLLLQQSTFCGAVVLNLISSVGLQTQQPSREISVGQVSADATESRQPAPTQVQAYAEACARSRSVQRLKQ